MMQRHWRLFQVKEGHVLICIWDKRAYLVTWDISRTGWSNHLGLITNHLRVIKRADVINNTIYNTIIVESCTKIVSKAEEVNRFKELWRLKDFPADWEGSYIGKRNRGWFRDQVRTGGKGNTLGFSLFVPLVLMVIPDGQF